MDFIYNLENILQLSFQGDRVRKAGDLTPILNSNAKSENDQIVSGHLQKVLGSIELLLQIYRDNYVTRFAIFIEHIFNQIQNLLNFAICNGEILILPLDSFFNIFALIIEITVLHSVEANILNLAKFYTCNLNEINLKRNVECDSLSLVPEELALRLRLISLLYETICSMKRKHLSSCASDSIEKLIGCMGGGNVECKLFSKLVNCNSEVVAAQTLITVIPKYIDFCGNNLVLEFIWDEVSKSVKNINVEQPRKFIVLCYLSDLYFLTDNKKLMTKIFEDRDWWSLIQEGLMNPDASVRKQALHLMKTSHHYIIQNDICFCCFKKEKDDVGNLQRRQMLMGRESSSNKLDEYKEVCNIIEYLEEKQIHLVRPIFNLIEKFIEKNLNSQTLGVPWVMIVIQRMLSHDNMKIVRAGLSNLLKIPISYYNDEELMRSAIKLLILNLNCTQLYLTDCSVILHELTNYFKHCSESVNGDRFFKLLVKEMCSVQWSSEALYFMASSLKLIKSKHYWQKDEINLIQKLLTVGSANHYKYIKSGMQCQLLLSCINLIDTKKVTLEELFGFLSFFSSDTCLKRYTAVWDDVVEWIKLSYSWSDFKHVIVDSVNNKAGSRDIGRIIVIAWCVFETQEIEAVLRQISASFIDGWTRPYCDMEAMEFNLSAVCGVINEASCDTRLLKIFIPALEHIILFIRRRLDMVCHIRDLKLCQNLTKNLQTLLTLDVDEVALPPIRAWTEDIIKSITSNSVDVPMQKFIRIKTLSIVMEHSHYRPTLSSMANLRVHLRSELNSPVSRTFEDSTLTRDLQTLWGRMNSEYLHARWIILSKIMDSYEDFGIENSEFVRLCLEGLDIGGHAVLEPLMTALTKALPSLLGEAHIGKLVDGIWNAIIERKKNDDFHQLIDSFVEMIYHPNVLIKEDQNFRGVLLDYSRKLLSENAVQVADIFMKHVSRWKHQDERFNLPSHRSLFRCVKFLLIDILPRALLFGQVPRKDERLIGEVCSMVEEDGLSPLSNDWCTHSEVRARAVLFAIPPKFLLSDSFVGELVEALIAAEEKITGNKSRYFADSHVHRVKLRLMQSLLILHEYMENKSESSCGDEITHQKLWKWVSHKLITENNQPSVRYMQQWLMFRYLRSNPSLQVELQKCFDEGLDRRTGSLCSLISVAYLLEKFAPGGGARFERILLPYCMAQHFSVRLYAQVAFQNLIKLRRDEGAENEEWELIAKSLSETIEKGNYVKNYAKLRDDFFFDSFDPVEHFTLETIFFDIPRLTNVSPDEWIGVPMLEKCRKDECPIKLRNDNESLKSFESGKWLADGSKMQDDLVGEDDDGGDNSELSNYQKKMIPVKCLLPDWEELLQSRAYSTRKGADKEGLVVVASLIDRIPNLGGLSRTCEVFGACELVVGSLKYTEDKQFQSLSVTAENWISITEVKPFHLSEYLINMKRMGYTVMAAEQTVNSRPLQSVRFPRKSLLLLGNEKEGIPPPLLPLMDICVEVPQKGIIRSLNVHVTGALFIWEYAKQHYFSR